MKKKHALYSLVIIFLSLFFVSCGNKEKDVKVLKLCHIQSESDLWHKASLKFKEEVEKKSDGKIEVKIYPNSTLGGDRDIVEGMQIGSIDIGLIAGVLSNFEHSFNLLEIPYIFDDEIHYKNVVNGEVGQIMCDRLREKSGIRVLDFWDRGPRHISSNKEIKNVDDIKGLKIRIPEIEAMKVVWEGLGAAPTTMAWGEVYTALSQNVIEAEENPIPFMFSGRMQEVQSNISLTAHKYEYVTFSFSESTWKSLNKDERKIITDASKVATKYQNEEVKKVTDEMLKQMQEDGMKVTEPDRESFRSKAMPIAEKYANSIDKELYQKILESKGN